MRPAVPLVAVVVGLFVFGIAMMSDTRDVQATGPGGLNADAALVAQVSGLSVPPTRKPLNINVIGQRWLWRFEYPGGRPGDRVFSYSELDVPVDTTVLLHVTSTDVTHRWFIPALGGQVDAVPGQDTATPGSAPIASGIYQGQSTVVLRQRLRGDARLGPRGRRRRSTSSSSRQKRSEPGRGAEGTSQKALGRVLGHRGAAP